MIKKYPVWVENVAYTATIANYYDEYGDLICRRIRFYLGEKTHFWNKKYEHTIHEGYSDPCSYVTDIKCARRAFLTYLHTSEEQCKKELEEWDGKE